LRDLALSRPATQNAPVVHARRRRVRVVLLVAVVLLAVAVVVARVVRPSLSHDSPIVIGSAGPAGGVPSFQHVYVLVLENKSLHSIIGNPQAPYLNGLARRYARAAATPAATAHPATLLAD
jgi:hypothetical protein